jgi:predicted DNA repair protein MutK
MQAQMHFVDIDIIIAIAHHYCMRTTVTLDDDTFALCKQYAKSRSVRMGKALSELLQRGMRASVPVHTVNGLLVFDPPPGSPVVTSARVKELEADEL